MYEHMKLAAAGAGALALIGMGVVSAVDGGVAQATSTYRMGGAGETVVQETGKGVASTSVVISASPAVKAPPNGG